MKTIAVHLATGFEEIEAITIIDVLRRAGLNVVTVSITDEYIVKGSHRIEVKADKLFQSVDYEKFDMIVLPGGGAGAQNLDRHDSLKSQILNFHSSDKLLGAICAAPMVFGHLNLLKGKRAVCYPGYEKELTGAIIEDKPVVIDGNIITGKAAGSAMHFALKITEMLEDKEKSIELANSMFFETST